MKYIHRCENCIWFDQCHEDEACDSYEPASFEEQEKMNVDAYTEDLRVRHEIYTEYIDEQNG